MVFEIADKIKELNHEKTVLRSANVTLRKSNNAIESRIKSNTVILNTLLGAQTNIEAESVESLKKAEKEKARLDKATKQSREYLDAIKQELKDVSDELINENDLLVAANKKLQKQKKTIEKSVDSLKEVRSKLLIDVDDLIKQQENLQKKIEEAEDGWQSREADISRRENVVRKAEQDLFKENNRKHNG